MPLNALTPPCVHCKPLPTAKPSV